MTIQLANGVFVIYTFMVFKNCILLILFKKNLGDYDMKKLHSSKEYIFLDKIINKTVTDYKWN